MTTNVNVGVLATHWIVVDALPDPACVAGKIVIDTMNPYGRDEKPLDLGDKTSSEETAKRLPGAHLVKAFNTIWYKHRAEEGRPDLPLDERRAVLLAGDDAGANHIAAKLIEDIGLAPVASGGLRDGGQRQGPASSVFAKSLSGAEGKLAMARLKG